MYLLRTSDKALAIFKKQLYIFMSWSVKMWTISEKCTNEYNWRLNTQKWFIDLILSVLVVKGGHVHSKLTQEHL